jgi:hypothetical protein
MNGRVEQSGLACSFSSRKEEAKHGSSNFNEIRFEVLKVKTVLSMAAFGF